MQFPFLPFALRTITNFALSISVLSSIAPTVCDANDTDKTESQSAFDRALVAEPAKPPAQAHTEFTLVVAKHMMLLDGKAFITWPEIEDQIAELNTGDKINEITINLKITTGAREAEQVRFAQSQTDRLAKEYRLRGMSIGSLSPRTSLRYDRLETVLDLEHNPEYAVSGEVIDSSGKAVSGAEVIVAEPVDESISYKTLDLYVVDGKLRNRIDEVVTLTDKAGKFTVYPSSDDVKHYLIAMHHEAGFVLVKRVGRQRIKPIKLSAWATITGKIVPRDDMDQRASVSTSIPKEDGWPEISMTHYQADRRPRPTQGEFNFPSVPPELKTVFRRGILKPQGRSISLPTRELTLKPGESVQLEIGEFSETEKLHFDLLAR